MNALGNITRHTIDMHWIPMVRQQMITQHTANMDDSYSAKQFSSEENRSWRFLICVGLLFLVVAAILALVVPAEEWEVESSSSKKLAVRLALIGALIGMMGLAVRFSSHVRMFFFDKYVIDTFRKQLPRFIVDYERHGVSIPTRTIDDVIFFCKNPKKPFYVWGLLAAVHNSVDGYVIFHYDLSRNKELWLPINLFITGSIDYCSDELQAISEMLNQNHNEFRSVNGKSLRYPIENEDYFPMSSGLSVLD